MTIVITMRGLKILAVRGDPYFSFHGSFSLFFFLCMKSEENLSSRSLKFSKNSPSNSVHLTSSFSCVAVTNASLRVEVCENDGNF